MRNYSASRCLCTALFTALIGLTVSPPAHAGVHLIQFEVVHDGPSPRVPAPPAGTVYLAMDGNTHGATPLPAVPAVSEYGRLIRARSEVGSLANDLMGETVDFYTGETDFVAVDVRLPGNDALPVAVGRRYQVRNRLGGGPEGAFGDWDIDVPHVEGVFAENVGWTVPGTEPSARCKFFNSPLPATVFSQNGSATVTTIVDSSEYTQEFTAVIPGVGRRELLLRDPNSAAPSGADNPVTTEDLWAVRCPQREGAGPTPDEGFEITTPDGIKYTFTQTFQRPYYSLKRPADTATVGVEATVPRVQYWLMPSKIEDRYGNWVTYTYNQWSAGKMRLEKIEASDGRKITLTYQNGRVSQISNGSSTWNYVYSTQGSLTKVMVPDGTTWEIDLGDLFNYQWTYNAPTCATLPTPTPGTEVSGTLTHPSGATGVFTFKPTRHGRNGAPTECLSNSAGVAFARNQPAVYDVLSLKKKEISGPRLPSTLTWAVTYEGCTSTSCSVTKKTKVEDPNGYESVYTFGAEYGEDGDGNEGMLLSLKSGGSGAAYARTETYTYFAASGHPYPTVIGLPAQVRGDASQLSSLRPIKTRTLSQDGATYTRTASNPDKYGYPATITRTGTETKTDSITYHHNTSDWVLGTIDKITSGGSTEIDFEFNGHSQPTMLKRFGRIYQTYGYNGDGTMDWMKDGAGNLTDFRNYHRGIPQGIYYEGGAYDSFVVSNIGTITSHRNPMGHTTSYGYDEMGRVTSINPPGVYNTTSITWELTSDGWRRQVSTGDAWTVTRFDALLRPISTSDSLGRNVTRDFDVDGNPTFVSYPGELGGVAMTYDRLGRILTEKDGAGFTKDWSYGANSITVSNRNNHSTTYAYVSYDEPNTRWPLTITTPEHTTRIERDLWWKPKNIIRDSVTRKLTYNVNQLLWKVDEPETGVTEFTYDSAGNIETVDHAGEVEETRTYDGRNRLKKISYDDGTPSTMLTWRDDSQPDSESRGNTVRDYEYDDADILKKEKVTIDGVAYSIGYAYDNNLNLTSLTYPDNTAVAFLPDHFGRPSKVGTYAKDVTYFPNDAAKSFTFGNGITHSLTQDDRLLPDVVTDTGILRSTYGYDNDGNPTSISDSINSAHSRTLTYDDVGRLATAAGPWGSSTFTYDELDNLTVESGTHGAALPIGVNNKTDSVTAGGVPQSLIWDSRGRLTQKGAGATASQYTFDGADRLTKLTQGARAWNYTYDARGYRATSSGPDWSIVTVYDRNGRLLYESSSASAGGDVIFKNGFEPPTAQTTTTKYLYLNRHLVAQVDKTGTTTRTQYVHSDALGTTLARTDASRAVTGASTRLAYGKNFASAGTADEVGPAYAGHYADDTGLIYMQQRYYDPQLRRFISADPAAVDTESGSNFSRYAYASNSPFRNVDPDGRYACEQSDDASDTSCWNFEIAMSFARDAARSARLTPGERKSLQEVVAFIGFPYDGNSVKVTFLREGEGDPFTGGYASYDSRTGTTTLLMKKEKNPIILGMNSVHEGKHGLTDSQRGREDASRSERFQNEVGAYTIQAYYQKALQYAKDSNDPWTPFTGVSEENIRYLAARSVSRACRNETSGSCGD